MSRRGFLAWKRLLTLLPVAVLLASGHPVKGEEVPKADFEMSTILMQSTYLISGTYANNPQLQSQGTAFIVGKPVPGDAGQSYFVLVTAAHVVEQMSGEIATLSLRVPRDNGSYQLVPQGVRIRNGDKPAYVKHPDADVVAMYAPLPSGYKQPLLSETLLVDDATLNQFEIHPGDILYCLGYPLGAGSPSGFPILRSGPIASYPLTPSKAQKAFYFDFHVFPGNSGGPVYFVDQNRRYGGSTHIGETVHFVVGLVTQMVSASAQPLDVAVVVPSAYIRETVDMLPVLPTAEPPTKK